MNLKQAAYQFFLANPGQAMALWTTFTGAVYYFWSVFAQSLRTPTKDSSQAYLSFFQLVNASAGNWHRSGVPKVENSPNFEDAVEAYLQKKANATSTIAAVNKIQTDQNLPGGK
jgi:hypothetical protein